MTLTNDQIEAAKHGEPVRITADGVELVLVRAERFEELSRAADFDNGEWTEEEMRALTARTFEDADTAGPIE